MSLTGSFKVNDEKIEKGVDVTYAANADGTIPTFTISRAGNANKRYKKLMMRTFAPHQRAMQLKQFPDEKAGELLMDVFIGSVLLGWNNVTNADVTGDKDKEGFADYNSTNAKLLFKNLPELYDDLNAQAADASLFREGELEESAKN